MVKVEKVDRVNVTTTIIVLLRQAVVLAVDMKDGRDPHVGYVREKLNSIPVVTKDNRFIFDKISTDLFTHFGLNFQDIDYTKSIVGDETDGRV